MGDYEDDLSILMERDGMNEEEAVLFLEYDYEVEEDVEPDLVKVAKTQRDMIERDVLPFLLTYDPDSKFPDMADLRVTFVKDLSDDGRLLGKYISGTHSPIFVILDAAVIEESAMEYHLEAVIGTTLLHEIGHAIQEAMGLRSSEKQAEKFAYLFWTEGKILPKFKR